MPNKMFLKLEGIFGDSRSPHHVGEIEILSWEWNGNQILSPGRFVGNTISNLTITKARDTTSQILFEACFLQRQFNEAIMTVENQSADGSPRQAMIVKMKIVKIDSIGTKDSSGAEFVNLNFDKVEISYH